MRESLLHAGVTPSRYAGQVLLQEPQRGARMSVPLQRIGKKNAKDIYLMLKLLHNTCKAWKCSLLSVTTTTSKLSTKVNDTCGNGLQKESRLFLEMLSPTITRAWNHYLGRGWCVKEGKVFLRHEPIRRQTEGGCDSLFSYHLATQDRRTGRRQTLETTKKEFTQKIHAVALSHPNQNIT